jgi:hypothetical protein
MHRTLSELRDPVEEIALRTVSGILKAVAGCPDVQRSYLIPDG